jgi:hypothetical protein
MVGLLLGKSSSRDRVEIYGRLLLMLVVVVPNVLDVLLLTVRAVVSSVLILPGQLTSVGTPGNTASAAAIVANSISP